jgi:hypothetical protein
MSMYFGQQPELAAKRMQNEWVQVTSSTEYKELVASVLPHHKFVLDGTLTPDGLLQTALAHLPFCECHAHTYTGACCWDVCVC